MLTVERIHITDLIRVESGEDDTRMKRLMAADMETALLEQGVSCHPRLAATTTGDSIRLFRAESRLAKLARLLQYPGGGEDAQLTRVLSHAGPVLDEL